MMVIDKPLTNLQLELLKLYSLDLSDDQLLEIKRLIANYFAEKASDELNFDKAARYCLQCERISHFLFLLGKEEEIDIEKKYRKKKEFYLSIKNH